MRGHGVIIDRKEGEHVYIDDDIVIRVLKIRGSRIKIQIEAPQERKIRRGELKAA